jgi:HK97 family phage portal protein
MVQWAGGGASASGVVVDAYTAFQVSALWKGVGLIATAIAKCATHVYSVNGDTRQVNRRHPAYQLVRYKPNHYQRAFDFKQQMQIMLLLYGNAYAWIKWNGRGLPEEIIPIHPSNVQVYTTPDGLIYEATLYYDTGASQTLRLDSSEMLHLTWLSRDGFKGIGLLEVARDVIGEALAMQTFSGAFFKNSARPDIAIKSPKLLNPIAKKVMREDWMEHHSGDRRFGVVVLDEGMEVQLIGQDIDKTQLVELRQQAIRDVANFLQLPPSKLGDMTNSAYNSLEQDALAAMSDCYDGHIVNWEEAYNEKLLSTSEQRSGASEFAFDRTPLLSADLKTEAEFYAKALGNNQAFMTPNEVRARKGMNPIEGGNELPRSTNQPQDQPSIDPQSQEALADQILESVQRAVSRSVHQAKRAHQSNGLAGALVAISEDMDKRDEIYKTSVKLLASIARRDTESLHREFSTRLHGALCTALTRAGTGEPEQFESRIIELTAPITEEIVGYAKSILLAA